MKSNGSRLCPHCNKIAHETQHAAMRAVSGIKRRPKGKRGRAYRCPWGHWHITKVTSEVNPAARTRAFWDARQQVIAQ